MGNRHITEGTAGSRDCKSFGLRPHRVLPGLGQLRTGGPSRLWGSTGTISCPHTCRVLSGCKHGSLLRPDKACPAWLQRGYIFKQPG